MSECKYNINDIVGVYQVDDKDVEWFDNQLAAAYMLIDGPLYLCDNQYVEERGTGKDASSKKITSTLAVNCNDVFAWACADDEPISCNEIKDLFLMWHKDKTWGAAKWVCIKRNMRPQKPMVDKMKKENKWCAVMENLPKNNNELS